jgi:hypothetical protein
MVKMSLAHIAGWSTVGAFHLMPPACVCNINNGREYTGGSLPARVAPLFGAVIGAPRSHGLRAHYDF